MIYFVNTNIGANKSGIEHAELKRMQLFEQHHTPAKIVTTEWHTDSHQITADAGLSDSQLLNLFDFYQKRLETSEQFTYFKDLDFGVGQVITRDDSDKSRLLVQRPDGRLVARVNYNPKYEKCITSVEMFDGFGNLYAVDNYDSRGFKSEIDWYSPDNQIDRKEWLTSNGQVVIRQVFNLNRSKKLVSTAWWLKDRHGKQFTFSTWAEVLTKFYNDLNEKGNNIFVLDRALSSDEEMLHLKRPAYLAYHMHNSQGADSHDEMHSVLNNNYEYGLNNIDRYSAVISATPNQTEDLKKRFKPQRAKLFTIPVGIVPDSQLNAKKIPESKRTFGKVIIAARISSEKQIPKIVNSIALVHKQVPEVTLDIWGYTNSTAERDAIKRAAKKGNIEDAVHLKGYSENIGQVYDDAQIFVLASSMEGFNLAIMEATSHGDVGVTYDTNYGPNSIIQNGQNGYVVPYNDEQSMADKIIKLLKDQDLLQKMSDQAYQLSNRYSSASVWRQWQALLDDAKVYFGED